MGVVVDLIRDGQISGRVQVPPRLQPIKLHVGNMQGVPLPGKVTAVRFVEIRGGSKAEA
jgi:hypothetical protein